MTEAEWLACARPKPMLVFLQDQVRSRKLRLFACACCRRLVMPLATDIQLTESLLTAEWFADGEATQDDLEQARETARKMDQGGDDNRSFAWMAVFCATGPRIDDYVSTTVVVSFKEFARWEPEYVSHAEIIRDIFGNPFRPVTFSPTWLTDTAVSLARGMYESRDFSAMPILADAFQDAGCDSADILDHCRSDGPHVRGCWVVDAVLGKG